MDSSKPKIKLIDLFSGAGGLSNGFEQTGRYEVVGAVEINDSAAETYIYNHKQDRDIIIKAENGKSDITKIKFDTVLKDRISPKDKVVVIGGPPCQGFSNANRQKNYLISGNNLLVIEFVRAIKEINPVAFLMENVKTMGSEKHKFFVTEHVENQKFEFTSEKFLKEIKDKQGLKKDLWKPDELELLQTRHQNLDPIIKEICKEENSNKNIDPIVINPLLLSRLRSIERIYRKLDKLILKTSKEQKEINLLIQSISEYKNNKSYSVFDAVINNALGSLEELKEHKEISSSEIKETVGSLIDLNSFLLRIKELKDEKIIWSKPLDYDKESLTVKAHVKSYNLVKYLKSVFKHMGYKVDHKVLTASDFGVPQNRNRFMIFGVKGKTEEDIKVELPKALIKDKFTTRDAIYDLEEIEPQQDIKNYVPVSYKVMKEEKKEKNTLRLYYQKDNEERKIYDHINTASRDLSRKRFEAIKDGEGKNFHSLSDELKSTYTDVTRTQNTIYLRLNYEEPSPTVVNVRKSMWNHPKNAVALSIREAARLQSFKDDFKFCGTKDQRYQQIGNAVPPLMARAVAETILKLLGDEPEIPLVKELGFK